MVSLLPGVEILSDSCLYKDRLILNFIRACGKAEDFQIDVVIGPPTLDSFRTEYSRKARFLSLLDRMMKVLLFVVRVEWSLKQTGRLGAVHQEELETRVYENRRMLAVLAQARELYEQGPHIYLRAQENGGLITDGRR